MVHTWSNGSHSGGTRGYAGVTLSGLANGLMDFGFEAIGQVADADGFKPPHRPMESHLPRRQRQWIEILIKTPN